MEVGVVEWHGRPTLEQQVGEQQEQGQDHGQRVPWRAEVWLPASVHAQSFSGPIVRARPWYSPVKVCKNCTIAWMSSGDSVRPSCTRAIMATAASSVGARPS